MSADSLGSPSSTTLRTRAISGEHLIGALLRLPAEELTEMVAVSGFDFVLIDCEHGPADVGLLRHHLALASTHGVPVLVRIGSDEPALALRVLDQGAAGIVAPHVDSAAQARSLVDAVHYPPVGSRGFATYGRAGRFGLVPPAEHQQTMLEHTLLIGMIESPTGVRRAQEIIEVPGVDGIMIGTADLRASSTPADSDPVDAIRSVHTKLAAARSLRMDIVGGSEQATDAFADGANLVVYNLTATLMAHLAVLVRARS